MELDPPIYGGSIIRDNVRSLWDHLLKTKMYGKARKLTEEIRADAKYVRARKDKKERSKDPKGKAISNEELRKQRIQDLNII